MKIIIEVVPHNTQRYNTIGDWQWFGETLQIKVSDMGDWRKEMLVGIHELVETLLCKKSGITEEEVDNFDLSHPKLHEPGDSCLAPYHIQHMVAIQVEEILIDKLGIIEEDYLTTMERLQDERDKSIDPQS